METVIFFSNIGSETPLQKTKQKKNKNLYLKQGHVLAIILLALLNVSAATAVDKRAALFGVSISCEHT